MKTDKMQNTAITSFRGKYAFLSNFYEALIEYNGLRFRNNEAAFQAMKNPREAYRFTGLSAKEAKSLGKKVHLRQDWEDAKVRIMYEICLAKFSQHTELKDRLLATDNSFLEEGNIEFDVECVAHFGSCEGIYIEVSLHGDLGIEPDPEDGRRYYIGTLKTLSDDFDAMRACGELAGIITAVGRKLVWLNSRNFSTAK